MLRLVALGMLRFERMGVITDPLERTDDLARFERALSPVDRKPAVGEVETGIADAGNLTQPVLDLADAAGAVHAFDDKVHVRRVALAPDIDGKVEDL